MNRKQIVALTTGMALYWPLLRHNYFGIITQTTPSAASPLLALVVILATLFCFVRGGVLLRWVLDSRLVIIAGCCGTVAEAGLLLFGNVVVESISAALIALSFSVLTVCWIQAIGRDGGWRALLWATIGLSVSFVLSFTNAAPTPLNNVLLVLGFAGSSICWTVFNRPISNELSTLDENASNLVAPLPKSTVALICVLALFILAGSAIRGMGVSAPLGSVTGEHSIAQRVASLLIAVLIAQTIYIIRGKSLHTALRLMWTLLALLFFVSLFLIATLNTRWLNASIDVLLLGRVFMGFFLWIALVDSVQRRSLNAGTASGVFLLIEATSWLLSYTIIPLVAYLGLFSIDADLAPLSLFIALALIAGSFLFFWVLGLQDEQATKKHELASRKMSTTEDEVRAQACRILGERYGLTPKEIEVAELVSRGHSLKKVAEILVVSPSTVQTHIKSVYRKTDLHSKQEVLDAVSELMAQASQSDQ